MECKNIQGKLSAYIEGLIPSEEKRGIEEHLGSCEKCKDSLIDLRKTIEYVHNLEDVEPPSWLTQKIMANVRAEVKPKKGIIQKLFYPLYIKLPIEAVATVAIAIVAMYIFKTIQPEIKLAKAPSEVTAPQILPQEKEILQKDKENVIPPSPPLAKEVKEGFKAEQPMPAKKPELMAKYAEEQKAAAPITKQDKVTPLAGAPSTTNDELKREVFSVAPETKALAGKITVRITFSINVKDIELAQKEIGNIVTELGGKISKTELLENKIILFTELNSKKIEDLNKKLSLIGEAKKKETALEAMEDKVEVSIEIVKSTMQKQ